MKKKQLGFGTKLCYGAGNLGYGAMGQTISSFVMFYGTSVLGLSGALVGFVIALTSLWDGLSDPLIGYISDRTKSRFFGRRLGHMFFASFALALNNILLWSCPNFSSKALCAIWLLGFLLLQETFNTFFATPYAALCIDIAPDYNDQTNMQGFKTTFNIFGMILPSLLMSVFMPGGNGQFDRQGYINIALVNSAIVVFCGIVATFGTLKKARSMPNFYATEISEKHGLKTILKGYAETFKKKDFRIVMLGYSVCLIAMMFLSSVGMHLFTFCYNFSGTQISALMICLFGGAIISQPLWVRVVKKYDKKHALIFALCVILFGLGFVSVTFLFRLYCSPNLIFWFVAPCLFFSGVGSGALYCLPHSMYADVVTMEQIKTKENNAGRYTGYYTFTYNFSNSIALLCIGFLLQMVGFNSAEPTQTIQVQTGLGKIVFLGSAIAITIAILIFSEYSLKRADVLKAQIAENESQKL